jgi:hypothetical protein
VPHDNNEGTMGAGICHYTYTTPWTGGPNSPGTTYSFKVVAQDAGEAPYVFGKSPSAFEMKGSIALTAPGMDDQNIEKWYPDAMRYITWNQTGNIPTVDIWLDTDGLPAGALDYNEYQIASGVSGTAESYEWDIPNLSVANKETITSNTCRVRVKFDATTMDDSDYDFYIKPKFQAANTFTEITSGDVWAVTEASEQFTWDYDGKMDFVKLKFSPDGTNWYTDAPEVIIPAGNKSYIWPSIPTDNIVSHNNSVVKLIKCDSDGSNEDADIEINSTSFTIKGKINIVSPTTDQTYNVLDTGDVSWSVDGSDNMGTLTVMYNTNSPTYPDGSWVSFTGSTGRRRL